MKNLVLVTGSEGLVGSRFVELSKFKNNLHTPHQIELDITNPAELKAIFSSYDFKAVVHFAAFTDVSAAEKERGNKMGACWQINVEGTRNLVEAVKKHKRKIQFIHISTDMVFPGSENDPGPYEESHPIDKDLSQLTWYGYTKGEAERIVEKSLGKYATILRLIYPVRAQFESKLDYIRKPLSLYDQGKLYPLFSDQQISISFIDEVCLAIDKLITDDLKGIYHASSEDVTSPFELINFVIERVRGAKNKVKAVKLLDYLKKSQDPPFRYPQFGGLTVSQTEKALGVRFSSWREIVDKLVLQDLGKR